MKEKILSSYDSSVKIHNELGKKVVSLLNTFFEKHNSLVHQIVYRVKSKDSLANKIDKKSDIDTKTGTHFSKYSKLEDITDITGIRIITYLDSSVDLLADIIRKEFIVDQDNSIDKREKKPDQFGYRSLHYIVSFSHERSKLTEYQEFKNIKFEIQIRSILQHAWAEIEHDLGYKNMTSIPNDIKRDFNRLAALLETADITFDTIKFKLLSYNEKIQTEDSYSIEINQNSIYNFIKKNNTLLLVKEMFKDRNFLIFSSEDLSVVIDRLLFFKIATIGQLQNIINEEKDGFLAFAQTLVETIKNDGIRIADKVPIIYFIHYYAMKYYKYSDLCILKNGNLEHMYDKSLWNQIEIKYKASLNRANLN